MVRFMRFCFHLCLGRYALLCLASFTLVWPSSTEKNLFRLEHHDKASREIRLGLPIRNLLLQLESHPMVEADDHEQNKSRSSEGARTLHFWNANLRRKNV